MQNYKVLGKKGEGTFSEVLRCQSLKTGKLVAIKCMKHTFESLEQVNALREIQALRRLTPHDHIVTLTEVIFDAKSGSLGLVFELMDCNIYEHIKARSSHLSEHEVKGYMYQLLLSVNHMHSHSVFHRDIKPENVLLALSQTRAGGGKYAHLLKLADFGSCRGCHSKRPFTEYISTRWYRAPECLLTDGYYGPEMDIWGIGCVMYEIIMLQPLFPGTTEADQIERIHKILGTPSRALLDKLRRHGSAHVEWAFTQHPPDSEVFNRLTAHVSADAVDLLSQMLQYDMDIRITARAALKHKWFAGMRGSEGEGSPHKAANTAAAAAAITRLPSIRMDGQHQPKSPAVPALQQQQEQSSRRPVDIVAAAKADYVRSSLAPQVVPSPSNSILPVMPITLRFEAGGSGRRLQPLVVKPRETDDDDPAPPVAAPTRKANSKITLQPIGVPYPHEQAASPSGADRMRKQPHQELVPTSAQAPAISSKLPSLSPQPVQGSSSSMSTLKLAPLNPALVHLQPLGHAPSQAPQSSRHVIPAAYASMAPISVQGSVSTSVSLAKLREVVAHASPTAAGPAPPPGMSAAAKGGASSVHHVAASLSGARKHLVDPPANDKNHTTPSSNQIPASYARSVAATTIAPVSSTSSASAAVAAGSYRTYLRKRLEGYVSPYAQAAHSSHQSHAATLPVAAPATHKAAR